jgi:hypothetical protein
MPVGIEGLGQGLLQGYQFGLQQKRLAQQDARQVAQDERQAVQDAALAKTQDIANRTNEFQLQTGQKNQALAEKQQAQKTTLNQGMHNAIMAANGKDYNAAGQYLVDLNNNDVFGNKFKMKFNGSSVRIGKDGKPMVDEQGNPIVDLDMESIDASGKAKPVKMRYEDFAVASMNQLDPITAEKARQDKLEAKATKAEDRKNKIADELMVDDHKTANDIKLERVKAEAARKKAFTELGIKEGALTSVGLKPFTISEVVGKDSYGEDLRRDRVDTNQLGKFVRWAEANGIPANDAGSQKWIGAGSPDVGNAPATPKTDAGGKPKDGALYSPSGLDQPSQDFTNSYEAPAAKPSAVKESKPSPKTEKPKSEPAKKGNGNAGTKSPLDYARDFADAIPVMPPPKTYPVGTTFLRGGVNPLDSTEKVGTR